MSDRFEDLKYQLEIFLDRTLDTEAKKFTAKLCFGAGIGAATTFLTYKIYQKLTGSGFFQRRTLRDPNALVKVKLVSRTSLTPDVRRLRFALPSPNHTLGTQPGERVNIATKISGRAISKEFTPVSGEEELGHMDLIYKFQMSSTVSGEMAQYLENLRIGEELPISGPCGLLTYQGAGKFAIKSNKLSSPIIREVKRVAMIVGGTGISAIYPILRVMLRENGDFPKCSLVYVNKTEQDIIFRDDLKCLAWKNRDRFMLWYMIDKPSPCWKYGSGAVDEQVIIDWMPKPGPEILILLCGPEAMVNTCKSVLTKLKYTPDMVFSF